MKQLLLIATFLVIGFYNAQKTVEERFERSLEIIDSLNYKSDSLTYKLNVLNKIDYYRDKLLLSENYKNTERAGVIFTAYNNLVQKNFDFSKVVKDELLINKFFDIQKKLFKTYVNTEMTVVYFDRKMQSISENLEKEEELINKKEDEIINQLRSARYPIDIYNKLSNEEKDKLLYDITRGYKYSQ